MAGLTDDQAQLFLNKNFGSVATLRKDGTAQVTPVWLDYEGGEIVLNTAYGRAKERNLRRDPRVTVEVHDTKDPYRYVSVSGTAEFVDDGADAHIDRMAMKYLGVDTYPYRKASERRVIVRVRPERVDAYNV